MVEPPTTQEHHVTEAQTRTTAAQIADLLDRSTSMCDVLLATARTHPDDDAVRSFTTGQVWTYDELMARIGSVAQRLQGSASAAATPSL